MINTKFFLKKLLASERILNFETRLNSKRLYTGKVNLECVLNYFIAFNYPNNTYQPQTPSTRDCIMINYNLKQILK